MQMDEGEIIREYKAAKNKMRQVGILADLNCVTKRERWHIGFRITDCPYPSSF